MQKTSNIKMKLASITDFTRHLKLRHCQTNRHCQTHRQCRIGWLALTVMLAAAGAWADGAIRVDFNPEHVNPVYKEGKPMTLEFQAGHCKAVPGMQAKPDDPAWVDAAHLEEMDFFGMPFGPATWVRICFDDENLYMLMYGETADGRQPTGTPRERHELMPKYKEDIFHFTISPFPGSENEYLFMINAAGSMYDENNGDETWDGDWTCAVHLEDNGWYAEAAIPFRTLGLDSAPEALGFNVGRSGPGVMLRSWFNSMHYSTRVGVLRLGRAREEADSMADTMQIEPPVSSNAMVTGKSLGVYLPRVNARPQDRWIDATITLQPSVELAATELQVDVYSVDGGAALESFKVTPTHDLGLLSVDLRRLNLPAARLEVRYLENDRVTGSAGMFLEAEQLPSNPLNDQRVEIVLDVPAETAGLNPVSVTFGLPLPAGTLWEDQTLRLVDDADSEIPSQAEIVGRWARDGAIQWLRFDAVVDPSMRVFVEAGQPKAQPALPLRVTTNPDDTVELDTGAARYILEAGISPVREIYIGERLAASSAGTRGLYVKDQTGRLAVSSAEGQTMEIEAAGPVAACVRFEGFYRTAEGEPLARHITRVEAWAGRPEVKVTHTLVITRDTNEIWFREVGWELAASVGANTRAVFNTQRADPSATVSDALAADTSAYMLQREHERFGGGTNYFEVVAGERRLAEGEECGDWALLAGADGGLLAACRETARQHPKEFELSQDRLVIKLFSNRAGEELDFRSATLADKWNLTGDTADDVARADSNAAGWSKTHELMLAPLAPADIEEKAVQLAALNSHPVYALPDPEWIYATRAMGPLHPRAPEKYPEIERLVDEVFQRVEPRGDTVGHYGFMDYFAGPTYGGGSGFCRAKRYRFTYGLRSSIWLAYARSGCRDMRVFAEKTNRAYLDNYLIHWDVPGKVRGVFTSSGETPYSQLPFYWGQGYTLILASSSNLEQFRRMYYLTGYRRAGDALRAFAEGARECWYPTASVGRPLMVLRMLTQSYTFTWDPALRALAEATLNAFIDMESEVMLTKNRHYGSSTYKTREDVRALADAWRVFGDPKYRDLALAVAYYWWRDEIGGQSIGRMRALPHVSEMLYEMNGDATVLAGLDAALRRAGSYYGPIGSSSLCSVFESLPYAMGVLGQAGQTPPPWINYRDYGYPSAVIAHKKLMDIMDLTVQVPAGIPGRQFELTTAENLGNWRLNLNSVIQHSRGAGRARVPKDAPAGTYRVNPLNLGEHFVARSSDDGMVLYAPSYWHLPEIAPPQRVYFKIPEDATNPQIMLEGHADLFDPAGELYEHPDTEKGWIDLPSDRPGLWSFEPRENRLVRVRNLPPFFAFGRPENYCEPAIPWESGLPPIRPLKSRDTDDIYVPGPDAETQTRALYLSDGRAFVLEAGDKHPGEDGGLFLPYKQGTIELFFKPDWNTFDLKDGSRRLIDVLTDASPWSLTYRIDPEGTQVNLGPRDPSHSLYGTMHLANGAHLRNWLTQQLFERDEWVHLAWSWGLEPRSGPHGERLYLMTMRIYVNGKGRVFTIFRSAVDQLPAGVPRELSVTPGGAVDWLRVSDVHRYKGDFEPPVPGRTPALDEHTRALFEFDDTLEGQSPSDVIPVGVLRE